MTDLEKIIYNKHLAVSRSLRSKPFKLKTNFTDFENDTKYISVKRLANFFIRHPDINMDVYFSAPYKLYNDVQYFDLGYFASPRAIKTYTIYKQQLLALSPDSQIDEVKESLIFISKFCINNKIQLHDYSNYENGGNRPIWMYHYKENKINLYSLMEFPNILSYILEMPEDERELLLGSFGKNFLDYRNKYMASKKLRPFLSESFIKLKLFIDKDLNSSSQCV